MRNTQNLQFLYIPPNTCYCLFCKNCNLWYVCYSIVFDCVYECVYVLSYMSLCVYECVSVFVYKYMC